ncbi:MAG: FecR domain-containing protein [Spirochaetota bacterium]
MIIQKKNIFVISVISLVLIMSLSCSKDNTAPKESSILIVQTVLGDVKIQSGNETVIPSTGFAIKENSIIKTGKLSIIDIKYKDSGIIRISENTNINVSRLVSSEKSDETLMEMSEGKVFITVTKLLKDTKLQVKTPTSVAAVRGTSFRVSSDKGISRVDVLTGKVKVNPVQDNIIIDKIERIVEPDKAVEIDQKDIVKIVEQKKNIEIVTLQKEEIAAIKEEAKLFKIDDTFNEEIKNEIKEIGIETKPAEEIKDNKVYEAELIKQLEKVKIEKEAELKEKEIKAKKAALEEEQKKKDEQKNAEKAQLKKLELEKREKEKAAQEHAKELAKEQAQQKQKQEEKKKEESRVKNIPNF